MGKGSGGWGWRSSQVQAEGKEGSQGAGPRNTWRPMPGASLPGRAPQVPREEPEVSPAKHGSYSECRRGFERYPTLVLGHSAESLCCFFKGFMWVPNVKNSSLGRVEVCQCVVTFIVAVILLHFLLLSGIKVVYGLKPPTHFVCFGDTSCAGSGHLRSSQGPSRPVDYRQGLPTPKKPPNFLFFWFILGAYRKVLRGYSLALHSDIAPGRLGCGGHMECQGSKPGMSLVCHRQGKLPTTVLLLWPYLPAFQGSIWGVSLAPGSLRSWLAHTTPCGMLRNLGPHWKG